MTDFINPSENDVGGSALGRVITENVWTQTQGGGLNYVVSGLTYTINSPSNLDIRVAAGVAVIDGFMVNMDTFDMTLTASLWNLAWLKLTFSGGKVTGTTTSVVTGTGNANEDSGLLLGEFRCNGTVITDEFRRAPDSPNLLQGKMDTTLSAPGSSIIHTGFRPRFAMMVEDTGDTTVVGCADAGTFHNFGVNNIKDYGIDIGGGGDWDGDDTYFVAMK